MKAKTKPLYYADYLQLDKILKAQDLKSAEFGDPAHEEMLFIVIHQVYELWFKQIIHEIDSVAKIFNRDPVPEKDIGIAIARLGRIIEIQKILVAQIRVLETMTPMDFLDFRDYLLPASGFQSYQFRLTENKLGLKMEQRTKYNKQAYHTRLSEEHKQLVLQSEK